jgi:hypothetical protein
MPAIAMKGASFSVKRCLVFGYFVPVNTVMWTCNIFDAYSCGEVRRAKPFKTSAARRIGKSSAGNLSKAG